LSEHSNSNTKLHKNLSSKSVTFDADGSIVTLRVHQNWAEESDKGKYSNIIFLSFSLWPTESKVHNWCFLLLIHIQK